MVKTTTFETSRSHINSKCLVDPCQLSFVEIMLHVLQFMLVQAKLVVNFASVIKDSSSNSVSKSLVHGNITLNDAVIRHCIT